MLSLYDSELLSWVYVISTYEMQHYNQEPSLVSREDVEYLYQIAQTSFYFLNSDIKYYLKTGHTRKMTEELLSQQHRDLDRLVSKFNLNSAVKDKVSSLLKRCDLSSL